jgi:hypothetical protein
VIPLSPNLERHSDSTSEEGSGHEFSASTQILRWENREIREAISGSQSRARPDSGQRRRSGRPFLSAPHAVRRGVDLAPRHRHHMRTLMVVLIGVVLLPAAIGDPQPRLPTLLVDTITIREVRRGSDLSTASELGNSPDTLLVERPVGAREGTTAGVFVLDEKGAQLRRVAVEYGRATPSLIQIVSGVFRGDRLVVSDMRAWDQFDRLRLQ